MALVLGYSMIPLSALAVTYLDTTITNVHTTLNMIIGLLFVVATIVFIWGVIRFIASAGDEKKRTDAKNVMTWGIIGLAVMAAAWGIVQVLINYFGVGGQVRPQDIPRIPILNP